MRNRRPIREVSRQSRVIAFIAANLVTLILSPVCNKITHDLVRTLILLTIIYVAVYLVVQWKVFELIDQ